MLSRLVVVVGGVVVVFVWVVSVVSVIVSR